MSDISDAARMLFKARHDRQRIEKLPPQLSPQTREAAYAIQDELIGLEGRTIGGWKIGAGTGPEPFCSPLPAAVFFDTGVEIDLAATMTEIIEVEAAVELAADLPPRNSPYGRVEIEAAIGSFRPALEIVASRFVDAAAVPKLETVADMSANIAAVTGAARPDWRELELDRLAIELNIGGAVAGATDKGASLDAVIEALVWLANHSAGRNGGLKAGQIIITGARIIAPAGRAGDRVAARLEGLGEVGCILT